ncbi:interleukin-10 receptor subunit beta isoform X2 [Stegastes partitus]|uniref:Interleukin-10 receptor subunit beta isoform X2 n=1 Tax=Stegastes partitus TaxID=144197 RepID=A0A9Y4K7C6_9TELE|nr:PREDICTED: interferon alpha/beta receptor 2 isoform X2 [Stegastes partitus]
MDWLLLVLHLTLLLNSVTSLPAPVNVSVISKNFRHVLRWDPGPGCPPGTQYMISKRPRTSQRERLHNSTRTSFKLKLNNMRTYTLMVQASYNQTLSPWSSSVTFTPFKDTKIDPPDFSLAGCGNCIQGNISLLEAETEIDIRKLYDVRFKVLWHKTEEEKTKLQDLETQNKSFTLRNLEKGVEYCVQVRLEILLNKNTEPSPWKCTFTSHVEHGNGPFVLGSVTAILIFLFIALTIGASLLYYTGFLCKLQTAEPRALITALSPGYTLTPEKTTLDWISISSEMRKRRKYNLPTLLPATGEANFEVSDDDEDDEDKLNVYMDIGAGLSSGETPCQDSSNVSGKSKPAALRSSVMVEAPHTDFDQGEAKAEEAEVSLMHRSGETGVQGQVEKEEMKEVVEMQDLSNVNLFSVTLAAFARDDEEQEDEEQSSGDSLTDFLKMPTQGHLLASDSKRTLNHTYAQTESDNNTPFSLQTMHTDIITTGYEGRCTDIWMQHEEDEEEEFSGYLGHR